MWLEITTKLPCINYCSYCPQAKLNSAYKGVSELSFEKFKHYLTNINKDVEIHFSGFSEPFYNQEAVKMIKYADKEGYKVSLYTTLQGLTDEQAEELNDVKFKLVRVHDIGKGERDYKWIDNFSKVEKIVPRAGNLKPTERKETVRCSRSKDFKINVMLPNGDVVLCCQDYSLKHKLGSLENTNFQDLKREKEYDLCRYCEYAC